MIKATAVQKDGALDCLDIVEGNLVYQMNNSCYKIYTFEQVNQIIKQFNVVMEGGKCRAML